MENEQIGGEEFSSPIGADLAGPSDSQAPAEPTVYDVTDDSLIRIKGAKEPVKYGEHFRGIQSQLTKASQKAAEYERRSQEQARELEALRRQSQSQVSQGQIQSTQNALQALKQLPYLSGEQAAEVVSGIAQQIKMRDQVLSQALNQIKTMEGIVNQLNSTHVSSSFDSKISKWLQDGGYPAEAADLAKEIYLAYEGDDLDSEFPQIFANRWKQIQSLVEASRRAQVQAARKPPFIPGRGGKTGPSAPLQMRGNESPRAVADQLWDAMNTEVNT